MRNRLRRLEGEAEGLYYVSIPQYDGPPKRFPQSAFLEAWSTSVKRLCGEDVPEHPMSTAFRNSPDPDFHNCLIARQSREEMVS
jgi:hypothetical protein